MGVMITLADFYEKGVGVGPDRSIAENLRSAAGALKSVVDEEVRAFSNVAFNFYTFMLSA